QPLRGAAGDHALGDLVGVLLVASAPALLDGVRRLVGGGEQVGRLAKGDRSVGGVGVGTQLVAGLGRGPADVGGHVADVVPAKRLLDLGRVGQRLRSAGQPAGGDGL